MMCKFQFGFVNSLKLFSLYIYGGLDIREGSLENMWAIDTNNFDDFDLQPEDQEKICTWNLLETKV